MSVAEPFPLYFPFDARRPFENDDSARRIGRTADLRNGSRVLELGASRAAAGLLLAKELGCEVVAVDSDDHSISQIQERVKAASLTDRVTVRKVDFSKLTFGDGEFDLILIHGRVLMSLAAATRTLRRFLAPRGRLALTYPVRVGRFPVKSALEFWEKRLGESLLLPREVLLAFERAGFEPENIETLGDAELAELYRGVEQRLNGEPEDRIAPLKAEIEMFRQAPGKATTSYALAIGRRKEPGEKPPASRDRG